MNINETTGIWRYQEVCIYQLLLYN